MFFPKTLALSGVCLYNRKKQWQNDGNNEEA